MGYPMSSGTSTRDQQETAQERQTRLLAEGSSSVGGGSNTNVRGSTGNRGLSGYSGSGGYNRGASSNTGGRQTVGGTGRYGTSTSKGTTGYNYLDPRAIQAAQNRYNTRADLSTGNAQRLLNGKNSWMRPSYTPPPKTAAPMDGGRQAGGAGTIQSLIDRLGLGQMLYPGNASGAGQPGMPRNFPTGITPPPNYPANGGVTGGGTTAYLPREPPFPGLPTGTPPWWTPPPPPPPPPGGGPDDPPPDDDLPNLPEGDQPPGYRAGDPNGDMPTPVYPPGSGPPPPGDLPDDTPPGDEGPGPNLPDLPEMMSQYGAAAQAGATGQAGQSLSQKGETIGALPMQRASGDTFADSSGLADLAQEFGLDEGGLDDILQQFGLGGAEGFQSFMDDGGGQDLFGAGQSSEDFVPGYGGGDEYVPAEWGDDDGGLMGQIEALMNSEGYDPEQLLAMKQEGALTAQAGNETTQAQIARAAARTGQTAGLYGAQADLGGTLAGQLSDNARQIELDNAKEAQRQQELGGSMAQSLYQTELGAEAGATGGLAELAGLVSGTTEERELSEDELAQRIEQETDQRLTEDWSEEERANYTQQLESEMATAMEQGDYAKYEELQRQLQDEQFGQRSGTENWQQEDERDGNVLGDIINDVNWGEVISGGSDALIQAIDLLDDGDYSSDGGGGSGLLGLIILGVKKLFGIGEDEKNPDGTLKLNGQGTMGDMTPEQWAAFQKKMETWTPETKAAIARGLGITPEQFGQMAATQQPGSAPGGGSTTQKYIQDYVMADSGAPAGLKIPGRVWTQNDWHSFNDWWSAKSYAEQQVMAAQARMSVQQFGEWILRQINAAGPGGGGSPTPPP